MTHPDADRWNPRYIAEGRAKSARGPRQLLLDYADVLPCSGLALDAAAGVANSGLFVAERGLRVIALDISEVGLRLAVQQARTRSIPLQAAICDLSCLWLPSSYFDVIINMYFLERATFPVYRRALKPGGLIFFEGFLKTSESCTSLANYLAPGELRSRFMDFEVLHSAEVRITDDDEYPEKVTEQLVARKPINHGLG